MLSSWHITQTAAAQALFLSEYQRKYIEIGLISIALFRSHCIRQGILSKRQDNRTWDENFNEERYWNDGWKYVFREDSLAATVFKDGCLWVTYDKNERRRRDSVKLKLTKTEWNSLAMLYALTEATSIYKFHNIDKLSQLMIEKMGWSGGYDFTNVLSAGIVEELSYGSNLWLLHLTHTANMYKENMKKALVKNLDNNEWKKILNLIKVLRVQHSEEQRKRLREFLVV